MYLANSCWADDRTRGRGFLTKKTRRKEGGAVNDGIVPASGRLTLRGLQPKDVHTSRYYSHPDGQLLFLLALTQRSTV